MLGICNMLLSVLCDTRSILPGMLYPCPHGTCNMGGYGCTMWQGEKKNGGKSQTWGKKIALTTMGKYDVRVFELGIPWWCSRS